jgi:hypothetical protein
VGQWQLKHAIQGEFAAKKYYEIILDHFSTELGRRGGHELLTFCEPESRAGGALAAQELNQLIAARKLDLGRCSIGLLCTEALDSLSTAHERKVDRERRCWMRNF